MSQICQEPRKAQTTADKMPEPWNRYAESLLRFNLIGCIIEESYNINNFPGEPKSATLMVAMQPLSLLSDRLRAASSTTSEQRQFTGETSCAAQSWQELQETKV